MSWTVAYLGALLVGRLAHDPSGLVLAWPAAGIAFLWLISSARRMVGVDLPLLATATAVVGVVGGDGPVRIVLTEFIVLQTILAVLLLRRSVPGIWGTGGRVMMSELRQYGAFLWAMTVAAVLTALLRGGAALALGESSTWYDVARQAGRNGAALITLGTFGLLLGGWLAKRREGPTPSPTFPWTRTITGNVVGILLASGFVFGFWFRSRPEAPTTFVLTVLVVWAAVAVGPVSTSAYCLLSATTAVILTLLGYGPIALVAQPELRALITQLFVVVLMLIGMTVALTRRRLVQTIRRLERSEAERGARAEELDMVIEHLDDGVAIVEEGGRFVHANTKMRQIMSGPSGERPVAFRPDESASSYRLFHLDGRPLEREEFPYVRALAGEVISAEEYLLAPGHPGGLVVQISAFPVPYAAGAPKRIMVVVRDVTAQTQSRDSLTSFASTVAHDLNNPLSVVDGWAEELEERLTEEASISADTAGPMVEHIRVGIDTMRVFVSDLLSHAVARDQALRCEPLSLHGVVKQIMAARDRPGLPSPVVTGDLEDVWADRVLVHQVVDNLIGNALKYVGPGVPPQVVIDAQRLTDGWVLVRVRDNGVGIPDDQRDLVFRSFHRVDRSVARGTGLGLTICKRIVERHGGSIRAVPNADGRGTSFEFTLPATEDAFRRAVGA